MKRDYPDRPIVGVGAVVVLDQRVVLVRRTREPLHGEWSIPGGALELGETLRHGIVREVAEETGLTVEVGDVLEVVDRIVNDAEGRTRFHYVLIDFLCNPIAGELRAGSDVSDACWFAWPEVERLHLSDGAEQVIRKGLRVAAGAK